MACRMAGSGSPVLATIRAMSSGPQPPSPALHPGVTVRSAAPRRGLCRRAAAADAPPRRRWSIRALLQVLVLATLAPVVALLAHTGYRNYRQAEDQAARSARGLAQVTADGVESFLADARLLMSKLALRPGIRAADPNACDPVFTEFRDLYPQFANLSQASLDGELICSTAAQPGGRRTPIGDKVWFQRVVREQTFVVAPPYIGPVTGKVVSVLAHPVRDASGRFVGSIQLPIDLVNLKPVVSSRKLPSSTVITIVDSAGTVVARSVEPERFVGTRRRDAPIITQVLAEHSGTATTLSSEGIERVYGFVPIAGTDWYAIAGIASDVVFAEARRGAAQTALLAGAILLFALGIALVLRGRIARPITALRDTAQRVAGGALGERAPLDGPAEIAEVASGFNAMLDAREEQLHALADSEMEFRLMFESSLESILRSLPDGTILDANPAACAMFGASVDELRRVGRAALVDRSDPRLAVLLAERERSGRASGELTMRRVDGSRFECAFSSALYTAADGAVRSTIFLRDLSDRLQKEELRAAKEAAELASREKSAFLARMSHELRTPLNAIIGFSQLLEHDPAIRASEKAGTMLGHVRDAGMHLLALIDEVLDLSRIEAGALVLSPQAVGAGPLVDECVALTADLAQRRGVTVRVQAAAESPWLRVDGTRARQLLVNLLSNAVKYNRAGGSVEVSVRRLAAPAPGEVEIAVQDTGVGLTPAQVGSLFQPFNRLGAERSGVEGTGLGLVIVRQLVTAMRGRIEVSSEPGRGSRFALVLPAGEPPDARTPVPPAAPAAPEGRPTVLYVEDNPANVELMHELLKLRPKLRLEVAPDGATGVAAAQRLGPALILLDINLPDFDGYEVLRRLRRLPSLAGVPCIALSANAMPDEAPRARAAGFAAYLVKPFVIGDLLARVDAAVA